MGKRLLVVDSDRRFIQDQKSQLESAFDVDFLYATEGALTRLDSGQYAGILLCVETSENKGYALCSAIRRTPQHAALKIALISAKASEEEYARHRGTKGKADLYLHKPIAASALIPALAALVPVKEDDPDNPLGDLAGSDLGDEWLESLKSELEMDLMPALPPAPEPVRPPAPPVQRAVEPALAPERALRNQGEMELLQWRVQDLETKLAGQFEELERKNREIEDLGLRFSTVTRNLDEAQQHQSHVELLRRKVQEQEAAEGRLREELQDALDEQKRLVDLMEEVNVLLAEKTEQHTELTASSQLIQSQLEEAWAEGDKARTLEAALAEQQTRNLEVEMALAGQEQQVQELNAFLAERDARIQVLEAFHEEAGVQVLEREVTLEAHGARIQELEAALEAQAGLRTELEAAQEAQAGLHTELEAAREAQAGLRAELEAGAARIQELEAAQSKLKDMEEDLTSTRDQVSFQELTIRNLAEERSTLRSERERQEEAINDQAAETLLLREQMAMLEAAHELQQRELMSGIDEREAHLGRLNSTLEGQRDRLDQMEREKEQLEAAALERSGRVQALAGALAELEGKARQALDLAKAVTD